MPLETETKLKAASIYGVWYIDFSESGKGYWVLQRDTGIRRRWGHRFEFRNNGEFIDEYFAPCGNDRGIHNWSGEWKYNEQERILSLQIKNYPDLSGPGLADFVNPSEDYKRGAELYLAEITEEMMRLKPKNTTEELWV